MTDGDILRNKLIKFGDKFYGKVKGYLDNNENLELLNSSETSDLYVTKAHEGIAIWLRKSRVEKGEDLCSVNVTGYVPLREKVKKNIRELLIN